MDTSLYYTLCTQEYRDEDKRGDSWCFSSPLHYWDQVVDAVRDNVPLRVFTHHRLCPIQKAERRYEREELNLRH